MLQSVTKDEEEFFQLHIKYNLDISPD